MGRPLRFVALAAGVVAILALGACASGYSQFYRAAPGATPEVVALARQRPPTGNPIVERAPPPADPRALIDAYAKRGYVVIGDSVFNSGHSESDDAALEQGRKVGADLVLILNPRLTGSTTTVMPLTTPTTTTSYSSGSATAYGAGGSVTAFGSGTTTTYGTNTTYIPITINRIDYGAVYFIKQHWTLGVLWRDLNDAERQRMQTNKGVEVRLVVDDTPAFAADILPGDIIQAVDGETVLGHESIGRMMKAHAGQLVKLTIWRDGQHLEKNVQLN